MPNDSKWTRAASCVVVRFRSAPEPYQSVYLGIGESCLCGLCVLCVNVCRADAASLLSTAAEGRCHACHESHAWGRLAWATGAIEGCRSLGRMPRGASAQLGGGGWGEKAKCAVGLAPHKLPLGSLRTSGFFPHFCLVSLVVGTSAFAPLLSHLWVFTTLRFLFSKRLCSDFAFVCFAVTCSCVCVWDSA